MMRSTSADGTTSSILQPLVCPTSMYSMKRRMWPLPLNRRAIGRISRSFTPRLTTMLILIGARPASAAASMPSSTFATGKSTSFIARKIPSSRASRLTVTRDSPAILSSRALCPSSAPLVVSVRSMSPTSLSISTRRSRCLRNSGSPPVSRIFWTPCALKMRASRVISSKVRRSL